MRIRAFLALTLTATTLAAQAPSTDNAQRYVKTNAMITMRDGVKLNTDIYAPKDQTGPLPVLFRRTPYGIDGAARAFDGPYKELADDNYIFVFQDIRGRYR